MYIQKKIHYNNKSVCCNSRRYMLRVLVYKSTMNLNDFPKKTTSKMRHHTDVRNTPCVCILNRKSTSLCAYVGTLRKRKPSTVEFRCTPCVQQNNTFQMYNLKKWFFFLLLVFTYLRKTPIKNVLKNYPYAFTKFTN